MGEHTILTTFSWAIVLGIFFIQLAHKMRISAIVILLLGGILAGPTFLNLIRPQLFPPEILKTIVALAIGLILFEGGLTLNVQDYRKVSKEIRGLLTIGVLVTWITTACCIHYVSQFSWDFSFLAASLVIVTGPTVIGPLLKRIHAKENVSSILHWEGVLIDPIGVFISLLCYEWIISGGEHAISLFFLRVITGIFCGVISGLVASYFVKQSSTLKENLNSFVLAVAIATFTISEHFVHESGLLSVIISGFIMGYVGKDLLHDVKAYKAQLIEILIGMLFILLSANLNVKSFENYGYDLLILAFLIMFLVRPLNILFSTWSSSLNAKEKLFLCWIAPRGIVAASMASLFAISLKDTVYGVYQSQFLETFTYSVIICTVLFQGLTAKWVGKTLGVLINKPSSWLIVGAHKLGRSVAKFIQDQGLHVIVMDTNINYIRSAQNENLDTIYANARFATVEDYPQLYEVGNVLAITTNEEFNILISKHWHKELTDIKVYACRNTGENTETYHSAVKYIWQKLPLRKLLNAEDDENLEIVTEQVDIKNIKKIEQILLCSYKNRVFPYVPLQELDFEEQKNCTIVRYTKKILSNELPLRENCVISSKATSTLDAIEELLELLKLEIPLLPIDILMEHFEEQQRKYVSLFGYDIALFHSYIKEIDDSMIGIARLEKPIYLFGKQIKIIFLVVSSIAQPQKHIETISCISKFILKPENRKMLQEAKSSEELLKIFF